MCAFFRCRDCMTHTIHRTAILAGGQYVHVMIIFTLCYMLLPVSNLIGCFLLSFLSFIIQRQTSKETNGTGRYKIWILMRLSLFSSDIFDRVDDPKNHLKSCITPELMNRFTKAGAPPHELRLKVDDICIVLRNLSKRNGLSNNVSNFTQFPTSVVSCLLTVACAGPRSCCVY